MPTTTGYEIRRDSELRLERPPARHRRLSPCFSIRSPAPDNLHYERRRYRLTAGDTMLVIVPHNHRYWVEDGGSWEFFWMSMSGQEAVRIHRTIQRRGRPVLRLQPRDDRPHRRLLPAPDRRRRARPPGPRRRSPMKRPQRFTTMSSARTCPARATTRSPASAASSSTSAPISTSRLRSPTSPRSPASAAPISRGMFTAQTEGVPPADFVLQERMRRAARC